MAKKKLPKIVQYIKDNPPTPINYAFEKNISFSQASLYWQCPKRWALHYRDGHKIYEQNIYSTFGTAMHETLQMYLDVMYDESGAAADRIDLIEDFEERLRNEYKKSYIKNNKKHFSDPKQIREFYDDGVEIINFFKKNRSKYFSKRGWHLVGCEIPIIIPPNPFLPNVKYLGYLDIVMYHEPTNTFKIIDIKTSTNGWNQNAKKDKVKQYQLVLYKKYFAEHYKVDIDTIEIEFFILRRKVWESSEFPIKRVQLFEPPSGKTSVNKASKMVNEFLNECFNREGFTTKEMPETPNANCKWCPYHKTHLCSATFEES